MKYVCVCACVFECVHMCVRACVYACACVYMHERESMTFNLLEAILQLKTKRMTNSPQDQMLPV